MRHGGRDFDQRFDAAQRLGQREELGMLSHFDRCCRSGLHHERYHPSSAFHLIAGDPVLWVGGMKRIQYRSHFGMCNQVIRDADGVLGMPFHAHRQGLDPAQDQEAVHGSRHSPSCVLQVSQFFEKCRLLDNDRAANHIRMSAQVFGS